VYSTIYVLTDTLTALRLVLVSISLSLFIYLPLSTLCVPMRGTTKKSPRHSLSLLAPFVPVISLFWGGLVRRKLWLDNENSCLYIGGSEVFRIYYKQRGHR